MNKEDVSESFIYGFLLFMILILIACFVALFILHPVEMIAGLGGFGMCVTVVYHYRKKYYG